MTEVIKTAHLLYLRWDTQSEGVLLSRCLMEFLLNCSGQLHEYVHYNKIGKTFVFSCLEGFDNRNHK